MAELHNQKGSWVWYCPCEHVTNIGYTNPGAAKADIRRHHCDLRPRAFRPMRLLVFCGVSLGIAAGVIALGWAMWLSL